MNTVVEGLLGDPGGTLRLLVVLTALTLVPAVLVLTTAFTRIIVVLSFLRTAVSTQQVPPNQVLLGLALFLTYFVMHPTLEQVNTTAIQPYLAGQATETDALTQAASPLQQFMLKQTREKDLALFVDLARLQAMGMMMFPPTMVSLPFKILLFVLVDGWHLVVQSLLASFH